MSGKDNTMDTASLKEFLALAETQNFWEASELLFMNESTLSKHIKKLESKRTLSAAIMEIHEKATNQELNFEKLRSSINLCCEVCLWDTSDAMMEPDKNISYWFFFNA